MIFGSVSFDGNTFRPDQILQKISQHLTWNDCICENFSFGSFYGVFITDVRLSAIREDVVYMDEVNGLLIMADGYIYNRQEISSKLSCDERSLQIPEMIAKAYLHWGTSFAEKLNGDFAICIYHNREKQILFYTDHFGLRPMAVSRTGKNIFFIADGAKRLPGKVLDCPVNRALPAAVFAVDKQVLAVDRKVELAVKKFIIRELDSVDANRAIRSSRFGNSRAQGFETRIGHDFSPVII